MRRSKNKNNRNTRLRIDKARDSCRRKSERFNTSWPRNGNEIQMRWSVFFKIWSKIKKTAAGNETRAPETQHWAGEKDDCHLIEILFVKKRPTLIWWKASKHSLKETHFKASQAFHPLLINRKTVSKLETRLNNDGSKSFTIVWAIGKYLSIRWNGLHKPKKTTQSRVLKNYAVSEKGWKVKARQTSTRRTRTWREGGPGKSRVFE